MKIGEVFDEMNDGYTSKISRWVPYYGKMISSVTDYLPPGFSPKRIMDLGCGNGNLTAVLYKKYPAAQFTLVDASREMLEECEARFIGSGFLLKNAFFQDLEFEENSFDLITAALALHHLKANEKKTFFKQVYNWLSEGGYFSFSDLLVDKHKEPVHSRVLQHWKSVSFQQGTTAEEWEYIMHHYDHYDFPDGMEKQVSWLEEAGFSDIHCPWQISGWSHILARKQA